MPTSHSAAPFKGVDQFAEPLRNQDDTPNLRAMQAQIAWTCSTVAGGEVMRFLRNEDIRLCRWNGQRDDGRMPDTIGWEPCEPWPGASDCRIRLADEMTNDEVKLCQKAGRQSRLTVTGTEEGSMPRAGSVQQYLDWLRKVKMKANVRRESKLLAEFGMSLGYAVLAVTWKQEWSRGYDTIALEDLQRVAQQAQQQTEAGPSFAPPDGAAEGESPDGDSEPANADSPILREPEMCAAVLAGLFSAEPGTKKILAPLLRELYPDCDAACAYQAITDWRGEKGEAKLPVRYLRKNEPEWEALRPWRDVFVPLNTFRLDRTRWIGWRVTLSVAELEEKRLSEDWTEEFIEQCRQSVGKSVLLNLIQMHPAHNRRDLYRDRMEEMRGMCEVFYMYYKQADANGVPCLYRTVISPHSFAAAGRGGDEVCGPDGPLGYDCDQYPFVGFARESIDRFFVESRGIPEVLASQQIAYKDARDVRVDQTDLALQPPLIRPEREVGLRLTIRPRGEIGMRRIGASSFMPIPNTGTMAQPLEDAARLDALRYMGKNVEPTQDPGRPTLYLEDTIANWCGTMDEAWSLTLKLAQQFGDDAVFARVVGGETQTLRIPREEIQGSFHLCMSFNTDTLNPETMEAKTDRLAKVIMPLDRTGAINWQPILAEIVTNDWPEVSAEALRSSQQASDAEVKDESDILGKALGAGIESPYHESGQNFQLRGQWLQQQLQTPATQAALQQAGPARTELVQKRAEHLQFMVQQQTNAQTGRVGVEAAQPQGAG